MRQGHNCRGHRHDIESVIMYFKNGVPVPVGASAHGGYKMKAWAHVPKQHSMQGTTPEDRVLQGQCEDPVFRFARTHKTAQYLTPPLADWFLMRGMA